MDELPVVPKRSAADEGGIESRVGDLKRDIEDNRYAVDAPAVADAILSKLRMLRQARQAAAVSGAGRSRPDCEGPQAPAA